MSADRGSESRGFESRRPPSRIPPNAGRRRDPDDRTGALAAAGSCHKFTVRIDLYHFLLLLSHESSQLSLAKASSASAKVMRSILLARINRNTFLERLQLQVLANL
jgi:hypothetical protein